MIKYIAYCRKSTDEKNKKLQKYLDFQRVLLEEVPASFLYYPKVYSLKRIQENGEQIFLELNRILT